MATYTGRRVVEGPIVEKDGKVLSPEASLKVWNHSPDGFEWGYGGSGPAQLALALLLDVTLDPELASRLHQPFKWAYVAKWGKTRWSITSEDIREWITSQEQPV